MDNIRISLKAARVNADLTLDQASQMLGVNKRTLWSWENGKTEPKTSKVEEMSRIYNIPISYFFINAVQSN